MELHQLRYFVAVVETGGFSRAADRCAVAQPSLSQQVIKLEKEIGSPLFDRLGRSIAITEAGRLLYPRAKRILMEVDSARDAVVEDLDVGRGRLTVGAIPTVAPYLLPDALAAFRQSWPEAELFITEDVTDNLVRMLVDCEIDIALMAGPLDDPRLVIETLAHEPLLCVVHPDHPFARRRRVPVDKLAGEAAVVLHEMHCLSQQVNAFCTSRGVRPRIVCRAAQLSTVMRLVALGVGISLAPQSAVSREGGQLRALPLGGPPLSRQIVAVYNASRQRPLLGVRLVEHIREVVAESEDFIPADPQPPVVAG